MKLNNKQTRVDLTVIILYAFLTVIMTYPLIFSIDSSVPTNKGDTLHNTWIMSWTVHSLLTDPSNLFNSNIYYPINNTFSFSEVQLTNSLFAMPILFLTENPIFAYNFILLLSFILSGLGVYYLVKYLTNNNLAGFASGIIFAFFPFKFSHLPHLQLLSTQWIPFSLLFLHKYFETKLKKNLILFFIFFSLQVITIGYLSIFLLSSVCIYLIYLLIFKRKILFDGISENLPLISLLSILLVLICSLFYLPYITSYESGYKRSTEELTSYGADIIEYLSVSKFNVLYRDILYNKRVLFPGFIPAILVLLVIIKFLNDQASKNKSKHEIFYFLVMCFGILMSFGPSIRFMGTNLLPGPYVLFNYIPGFNGIRYLPAYDILVMLGVSVLAGFGVAYLFDKIQNKSDFFKKIIYIFIIAGILLEYISIPIHTPHVATGAEVPEVYRWLSNDSGDYSILELPIPKEIKSEYLRDQFEYMYFSTYHWKKLVNGVTGYFPSYHLKLLKELLLFPSEKSIKVLQGIGVKYIVIHGDKMEANKLNALISNLTDNNKIILKKKFGSDFLYEVKTDDFRMKNCLNISGINNPVFISYENNIEGQIVFRNECDKQIVILPDDRISIMIEGKDANNITIFEKKLSVSVFIDSILLREGEEIVIHLNKIPMNKKDKISYVLIKTPFSNISSRIEKIYSDKGLNNSLSPGNLNVTFLSVIAPNNVSISDEFTIIAKVINNGDTIWLHDTSDVNPPGKGEVRMAIYSWYNTTGEIVTDEYGIPLHSRAKLNTDVFPNQTVYVSMSATAPQKEGEYTLKIDMVDELFTWFYEKGSKPIIINISVQEDKI